MHIEHVAVVVIGGGPAGLGISYLLTAADRPHVVIEEGRIAESWRSRRWDALCLSGANWSLQLVGCAYAGDDPNAFMPKDEVVAYIEAYARSFGAPVREGVRAIAVEVAPGGRGFHVHTTDGHYRTEHVVLATGRNRVPSIPAASAAVPADIIQVVASEYRNPDAFPPGAVLVVGSGQSGCQIAEELRRHGRQVYLSAGHGWWAPAWYRGHDLFWWFVELGGLDAPASRGDGRNSPQATGHDGGRTLNLHTLARDGVILLGRIDGGHDGTLTFAPDLDDLVADADVGAREFVQAIDAFVERSGMRAVQDERVRDPALWSHPTAVSPSKLDVRAAGIVAVVWATGYRLDYNWVRVPVFDDDGYPIHDAGVAAYEGLYFATLPGRDTFLGVVRDATHIAETIVARTERQGAAY